jgi:hypothetical protein
MAESCDCARRCFSVVIYANGSHGLCRFAISDFVITTQNFRCLTQFKTKLL